MCSARYFPETALYPPRDEVVDFRRQLGNKYQSMGRSAQSAVDADGAATWISEYLRYRTSGCDHTTATQRTMTQIDGNPAPETCLVQCAYRVSPQRSTVPTAGGTFTADVSRTSGSCDYVALSESPWITLARPISGSGHGTQTYNVANNTGGARTGWVRFQWPAGVTYLEVQQGSLNLAFQFIDPGHVHLAHHRVPAEDDDDDVHVERGHAESDEPGPQLYVARAVRLRRHQGLDTNQRLADFFIHSSRAASPIRPARRFR